MKFVIQRVESASVCVDEELVGKIASGLLVLIGICEEDTKAEADKMLNKLIALRIFEDAEGKTNLSLHDVGGELLLVPQFTLYADCKKGNRPSFINAARPEQANPLFEYIVEKSREKVRNVKTGKFGAHMKVELVNDGPFTIVLDTREL